MLIGSAAAGSIVDSDHASDDEAWSGATATSEAKRFEQDMLAIIPSLRAYANYLTRRPARADDLTQDTIVRMLEARRQFIPGTSLRAWAFTIMRNRWISDFKRRPNRPDANIELTEMNGGSLEAEQPWICAAHELRKALNALSDEQREVVILIGALGCSYAEVSAMLDTPEGTVKSRLNRGRERLAQLVGAKTPEEAVGV